MGFFGLSVHADRRKLVQTVADLRPQRVLLVYGDGEAKDALGNQGEVPGADRVVVVRGGSLSGQSPSASHMTRGGHLLDDSRSGRRTAQSAAARHGNVGRTPCAPSGLGVL
ncbi:MBL fold metallo-hydrolase RNA specificity domain-containing protein [Alicyclobacillus macrosporangiidus]|uniref:MBL fold metallo-hydrolase RNA specificity domain-containing protein n=1 Tax=Alicyclobacillus macrosporangiidus TaxID=392015 RepID=UPI001587E237